AEQKITPEDGAQLLSALAATVVSPQQELSGRTTTPMDMGRRLSLVGAAIVVIGFFLPWFKVDVMSELKKALPDAKMVMGNIDMPSIAIMHNGQESTFARVVRGADLWPAWILLALV